jgi:hypothetical protein
LRECGSLPNRAGVCSTVRAAAAGHAASLVEREDIARFGAHADAFAMALHSLTARLPG